MADTAKEFITPKSPKNIPGGSTGVLGSQNGSLNNVNKVGEVGKINEKVDISSDDLDMLRELAEIQSIQNFVELTPTVQVTTGNINNSGDIDSIITKIGQKAERGVRLYGAGGVHVTWRSMDSILASIIMKR
ncbi:hypothetical protein ACFSQ7_06685 [Paenibacillus rhizoplanae]